MVSPTLVDALRHENRNCQKRKGLKMKTSTTPIEGNSCDEKLVKISGDKLTSTCGNGDEHSYTVAKEAKVTCDGKEAKLSELKSGSTIRMTLCKDNRYKILAIDTGKHIHAVTHA
jgi:hypothetical protein